MGVLEQRLRLGAPEAIDRFVAEVLAEEERTRLTCETREGPSFANPVTGARQLNVMSNSDSVMRRLQALRAAREEAEGLRLKAIDEAEVLARLTALSAAIPAIEPMALDLASQFSPGELRQIAWHAEDSRRKR